MSILKKIFLEKEIKAILGVLDELDCEFDKYLSFESVKKQAKKIILDNTGSIREKMVKDNISPRRTAYSWINNVSGDMLESGQYHVYRGTLNQTGNELLSIFDISTDKLSEEGDMDQDEANQHKKNIRERINSVG